MSALKCPNPSCPYLFDPTSVPPGVVLACPRCGMRFTLGPSPAAPPPGAVPPGAPTATFPGAVLAGKTPRKAPAPAANPAFAGLDEEPSGETETVARRTRPRLPVRSSRRQTFLLVLVGVVALAAAGVAIWYKVTQKQEPDPIDPTTQFKDLNLSLQAPPSPWTRDEDTRARLGSPYKLVYKRDNPEAVMAFGAHDYQTRPPRTSELRGGLTEALGRILEPGTLTEFPPEVSDWMGEPVKGFKFTGQLRTGPAVEGEAYAVTYKGMGYWFLAWTGEADIYQEQKAAFADARKRFKLLDLRKDWKEKQSAAVPFKNNVLGYTLLDGEGIWQEETREEFVKGEDPKADKFLRAKRKRKGSDFAEEAELTVYILDAAGDPLQVAREYVEGRANAHPELHGKNTFTEYNEKLDGDPVADTVDIFAPYVVLRSTNERDPNQSRLWVISAIKVKDGDGEKIVAVAGKCLWTEHATFDTRLVQIARSLHPGGG